MRFRNLMGLVAIALAADLTLVCGSARAAAFTPGDIAVYRIGDGAANLVNTGNAVFIDEYTPAGTLVQSISMPSTGGGNKLIASGTATSEGYPNRSENGIDLTLTGYNTTTGGGSSLAGTTSAAVNRIVGIVDTSGAIDLSTSLNNFATANNPRSAITTDGTNIFVAGADSSPGFTTKGASTSTQVSTTQKNLRAISIYGDQLFVSTSSGSTFRIGAVGSGVSSSTGQTITNIPGGPTAGSPYQFYFADLGTSVSGLDTLYVAEDSTGGGQIQKYSLVGGAWVGNGTVAASAIRGLTGSTNGTSVQLFGATGGSASTGGGALYSYSDTSGYNGALTGTVNSIATAASKTAFRGVAFAPAPQAAVSTVSGGTNRGSVSIGSTVDLESASPAGDNNGNITLTNFPADSGTSSPLIVALDIERGDGAAPPGDFANQIATLVTHLQLSAAAGGYVVTNLLQNPGEIPVGLDSDFEVKLQFANIDSTQAQKLNFDFFNDSGLVVDRAFVDVPEPRALGLALLAAPLLLRRRDRARCV